MASHLTNLRREFRPMLRMALPLALAELGWMAMGVVDTIMAGRLGAAAIGAGSGSGNGPDAADPPARSPSTESIGGQT